MTELPPEIKLEKGEEVKTILRREFDSLMVPAIIIFTVLTIISLIIYISLSNMFTILVSSFLPFGPFNHLIMILLIIALFLGLLGFTLGLGYMYVRSHRYILTDRKIIIYKKFIGLFERELTYSRITDMVLRVGIFGRLLNYGNIVPVSGAMEATVAPSLVYAFTGVANTMEVYDLMNDLREKYVEAAPEVVEEEELVEVIASREGIPSQIRFFQNEKVMMALNRKYLSFVFKLIWIPLVTLGIAALLIGLPMFILISTAGLTALTSLFNSIFTVIGTVIIIIGLIIWALVMILGYFYVRGHKYLITDQRIILIRIFIRISYRELDYADVNDIIVTKGPFGRIFNYGKLQPLTLGVEFGLASLLLSITGVPDPHNVRNQVLELLRRVKEKNF